MILLSAPPCPLEVAFANDVIWLVLLAIALALLLQMLLAADLICTAALASGVIAVV